MIKQRVLHIDLSNESCRLTEYDEYLGPIDLGTDLHLRVESYRYDVYSPQNIVVVGRGPFGGGGFFGSHRLVFVFRSPLTKGLHVSTLGGAAYSFVRTGLSALVIEGKAREPCILFIRGDNNGVKLSFHYINTDKLFSVYAGYSGLRGTRALAKYILENYSSFIVKNRARFMLVGPAAFKTCMGAIYSPTIDYFNLQIKVEDWAARGGGGSVLAKAHNVVAIVFGGNAELDPRLARFEYAQGIVSALSKKPYVQLVIESTKKYSYDASIKTGGTFGSNLMLYGTRIPAFNWRSLLVDPEVRSKIYEFMIKNYLEPFNKMVIESGLWHTCGEPCPVRCKKTLENRHIDYEPYNSAGPIIGVIDFMKALEVVDLIDELGYDAIEIGNVLGWLLESIEKGLLLPTDIGVEQKPVLDPVKWQPMYSELNARLVKQVLIEMTFGDNKILRLIAEKGLRVAAKELDEMYKDRVRELGIRFEDLAVYVPFGTEGHITPNFYWSPGVIAPLPILGRYWTYYTPTFLDPVEYAKSSIIRALHEYAIDNAGWCRFHRGWVEKILPALYKAVFGIDVDPIENAKKMYKKLMIYQEKAGATPVPWESKRVLQILRAAACEFEGKDWCKELSESLEEKAKEWWEKFVNYVKELV